MHLSYQRKLCKYYRCEDWRKVRNNAAIIASHYPMSFVMVEAIFKIRDAAVVLTTKTRKQVLQMALRPLFQIVTICLLSHSFLCNT